MAESTLSTQYSDLRIAIANYLGIGINSASWSENDAAIIEMIMKRGLRQFYNPPKVYDNEPPHQWSFLKPVVTLDVVGSYSTGTVQVSSGTCTLTTGTWPSWAATNGKLIINNTEYPIVSRDDDSELTVTGDDVDAGESYVLQHNGNYDLPEDFGGIEGVITFEEGGNKPDIMIVGEGRIRSLRANDTTRTYPSYAAIRPKQHTATTLGQRFEIMFFPIPGDDYTLSYRKLILPNALVNTTLIYPYGGAMHAETIEASCLAIAELQEEDKRGDKYKYFMERLTASIQIDKTAYTAQYLGYNGDSSDNMGMDCRQARHKSSFTVTYNGET